MYVTKKWGVILLSVWLILTGVFMLMVPTFRTQELMAILAIVAGVMLLLDR
jgi:membrane protein CcdC involved in cytochrome C biogenesis